jgi:hypothetical protein
MNGIVDITAHYFIVENRYIVVLLNCSPGCNTVLGKFEWFGESGKCWVSRHSADR